VERAVGKEDQVNLGFLGQLDGIPVQAQAESLLDTTAGPPPRGLVKTHAVEQQAENHLALTGRHVKNLLRGRLYDIYTYYI
jgi:hypothetical protein